MNLEVRLAKLHAFRHFDAEALKLFASSLEVKHLKEGELLVEEGDTTTNVYILLEGSLEVFQQGHGVIRKFSDDAHGQLIGLMTHILGAKRTASVRASSDVSVAQLSRYAFDLLYRHDGPASMAFCELVAAQLVADARTVHDAFFAHEGLHGREVSDAELSQSQERLNETLTGIQSVN